MVLRPKKRVRIYTTPKAGDQTIEGILLRRTPEFVVELADLIRESKEPDKDEEKVQIQGRVHILRENVAFYQVIAP